jgi:hypothetical protein
MRQKPRPRKKATAADKLAFARKHLQRVQSAWDPPDWDDLSVYGFYCLEAAVDAAALHLNMQASTKHWEKADIAETLHSKHNLPDVFNLLIDLNDARKAATYGDVEAPQLDAGALVIELEEFVDAVGLLLSGSKGK